MDLKNYLLATKTSKASFARTLKVSPALLHQWIKKIRPVAVQHCPQIEAHTKGKVSRADLRPSDWHLIWPELVAERSVCISDESLQSDGVGHQSSSPRNILDTASAVIAASPVGDKP